MHQPPLEGHAMRRTGYQNAVLTIIAAILGLGLIERNAGPVLSQPATASAQPDGDQGGMTNKLEQNKQMISELRAIGGRLERIESKLNSGLSVKVTDMPPIKLPPDARAKAEEKKPESKVEVKPGDAKPAEGK